MKKLIFYFLCLSFICSGVVKGGYSPTESSSEPSTLEIFQHLYGDDMNGPEWGGLVYTNGTITATRVEDFNGPNTFPGDPGQDLYLLSTSLTTGVTDQIWIDGTAQATARARYASLQQQFGYDKGYGYVELFDLKENRGFINFPADPVTFQPGTQWKWVRKGSSKTWYSSEADNVDLADHLITYFVTGLNDGKTTWVLFWDDQWHQGDLDFNDLVVVIKGVGTCIVPNVIGMTQADANTAIEDANLTLGTVTEQYSDTVAAGLVISQDPNAGTYLPTGSPVNIIVSLGASAIVPDVVDMLLADANTAIIDANLAVGDLDYQYSDTTADGNVISQQPAAGTEVSQGTTVDMVVSLGASAIVPDVVDMLLADANTAIIDANLAVGDLDYQYSDTTADGNVISQQPAAGTELSQGSAVDMVVSLGPMATVPDVTGHTIQEANSILADAGFEIGTETGQHSETVEAGLIISQEPEAGMTAPPGTGINLVVSLGPSQPDTHKWTNAYEWSHTWDKPLNWEPYGVPGPEDTVYIEPELVDTNVIDSYYGPVVDEDANVGLIYGPVTNSDSNQAMWIMDCNFNVLGVEDNSSWWFGKDGDGIGMVFVTGDASVYTAGDLKPAEKGTAVLDISGTASFFINSSDDGLRAADEGNFILNVSEEGYLKVNNGPLRGGDGSNGYMHVYVGGGMVDIDDELRIGDDGSGVVEISGGYVFCDNVELIARDGSSEVTLNVSGGNLSVNAGIGIITENDNDAGEGWMYVSDGFIEAERLTIANGGKAHLDMTGGVISLNGEFRIPGEEGLADANLHSGLIECSAFSHNSDEWKINLEEAMIVIDGNVVSDIFDEEDSGRLQAYVQDYVPRGDIEAEYDPCDNQTTVWAVPVFCRAWKPSPVNREINVPSRDAVLSWNSGDSAITHHLFISSDKSMVEDRIYSAYSGELGVTSFEPGPLNLGQTYYWCVDEELPGAQICRGKVWEFTVEENRIVDDMESYSGNPAYIYEVWIDGDGDANGVGGNGTGSSVNLSTEIIHSGSQSMVYYYDTYGPPRREPNYAEATRYFETPQDWVSSNEKALSLWFYGDAGNSIDMMYLLVNDNVAALAVYGTNPADEPADIRNEEWTEWNVDLTAMADAGADLANVSSLTIGFGDRLSGIGGGEGVVYFDDIFLYSTRCVPKQAQALIKDLNNDCVADWKDIVVLSGNWLEDHR